VTTNIYIQNKNKIKTIQKTKTLQKNNTKISLENIIGNPNHPTNYVLKYQ